VTTHDVLECETPFYIPAIGAPARLRRVLKHDDTFAVIDSCGDLGVSAGGADGAFYRDTRFLSHFELLIGGSQLLLLHSSVKDDNLRYSVDLTNSDLYSDDRLVLAKDTLHVTRVVFLYDGAIHTRIAVQNHGAHRVETTLAVTFASDFADIFEVRGMRRARRGKSWSEVISPSEVRLDYLGLDGVARATQIVAEPAADTMQGASATYNLDLAPRQTAVFNFRASAVANATPARSFVRTLLRLERERRARERGIASVETDNPVLTDVFARGQADLEMLVTRTAQGRVPYAGIPWYSTTFGRDAIITAMQRLCFDHALAAGVLRRLAYLQANTQDAFADSNPGKIIHEMRGGEMAELGEVPFQRYYGSVDSTPLFVMLAGAYLETTGDLALLREIWPAVKQAVAWIDQYGDCDGDGFVEYARHRETGLANQGWKDSHDSVFHADGSLARGPIALVEVQAYVYGAKRAAAMCARHMGEAQWADQLVAEAAALQQAVERHFWCDEIGSYVLALDGDKRPCKVRTSNAGHVLTTGMAFRERAAKIAASFMRPPYFSGWGVRTVAKGEIRYNPMSYHNGSVWPHDCALIAAGFARYGFNHDAATLLQAMLRAATYMEQRRLPELFCGFRRRPAEGPTLYPVACAPQAWAAGAPFAMLVSALGLRIDPWRNEVQFTCPSLPQDVGSIVIRNLRVGKRQVDVAVAPQREGIALEVLRNDAEVRVVLAC
jgi:glycogen debranching enzyme